jgi:hypothetical protein
MRPISLAFSSVNQRFPSGPGAIAVVKPPEVGTENQVTVPPVVIRPMS